jgi:hypothetical protein
MQGNLLFWDSKCSVCLIFTEVVGEGRKKKKKRKKKETYPIL